MRNPVNRVSLESVETGARRGADRPPESGLLEASGPFDRWRGRSCRVGSGRACMRAPPRVFVRLTSSGREEDLLSTVGAELVARSSRPSGSLMRGPSSQRPPLESRPPRRPGRGCSSGCGDVSLGRAPPPVDRVQDDWSRWRSESSERSIRRVVDVDPSRCARVWTSNFTSSVSRVLWPPQRRAGGAANAGRDWGSTGSSRGPSPRRARAPSEASPRGAAPSPWARTHRRAPGRVPPSKRSSSRRWSAPRRERARATSCVPVRVPMRRAPRSSANGR